MNLSKQQRFIVFTAIALIVLVTGIYNHLRDRREKYILSAETQEIRMDLLPESREDITMNKPSKIIVHIEGEVYGPGVYELEEGSRVFDAVEAAGGLTPDADRRRLNLAQRLTDEAFIYVAGEDEVESGELAASGQGPFVANHQDGLININRADIETLKRLNGIGDGLAKRIIDYREANGPFQQIEDIQQVSGIGAVRFQDIKDEITVR